MSEFIDLTMEGNPQQELHNFLANEFGYIAVESEMNDLIEIVKKLPEFRQLEAEKSALLSATIKQLIKDYSELDEFESPHVIFQMAEHEDRLEARCKELELSLRDCASKLESQTTRNPELPKSYRDIVEKAFELLNFKQQD